MLTADHIWSLFPGTFSQDSTEFVVSEKGFREVLQQPRLLAFDGAFIS